MRRIIPKDANDYTLPLIYISGESAGPDDVGIKYVHGKVSVGDIITDQFPLRNRGGGLKGKLFLYRCEGVDLSILKDRPDIHYLRLHTCTIEIDTSCLVHIRHLDVMWCSTGTKLGSLEHLPNLGSMYLHEYKHALPNDMPHLVDLEVDGCSEIIVFPTNCPSLERLHMTNVMFEEAAPASSDIKTLWMETCSNVTDTTLPKRFPKLESIDIDACFGEVSLSGITHAPRLETFYVHDTSFSSPTFFGDVLDVSRLSALRVLYCPTFSEFHRTMYGLRYINIRSCDAFKSWPVNRMPNNVEEIIVRACKNLERLPHIRLKHLTFLVVDSCPKIDRVEKLPISERITTYSVCGVPHEAYTDMVGHHVFSWGMERGGGYVGNSVLPASVIGTSIAASVYGKKTDGVGGRWNPEPREERKSHAGHVG